MKSLNIFALFAALAFSAWIVPKEALAQQASVNFQIFYDELSPYGTWVNYPNYGYVWMPNEDPGFSPYATSGRWVFTDDGWTWVSDYPWGWAVFHYGRWDYDNMYGWFWVPDNEWGPAWVSWRRSPGYYGWAPLRPGISVDIAFGRNYHELNERWIFVRERDISRSDVSRHYIDRNKNIAIIDHSTIITNTRNDDKRKVKYMTGPARDDVQRVTHKPVTSVVVREADRPGQRLSNAELQIYRPRIQKMSGNGGNPAPSKVMKLNEIKPASGKNEKNQPGTIRPAVGNMQNQPPNSRDSHPLKNTVKEQQPDIKNPSHKVQPTLPGNAKPSNSAAKERSPQRVAPANKVQPPQPRTVKPSKNTVQVKQPQKAAAPRKENRPAPPLQPKPNREEKEKEKRE
jgi:hypothetical protein